MANYKIVKDHDLETVVAGMNAGSGYVPFGALKKVNGIYLQILVKRDPAVEARAVWDYFSSSGAMIHLPTLDDAPTLMEAAFADVVENLKSPPTE